MEYVVNVSVGYYNYLSGGVKAWDLLLPMSANLKRFDTVKAVEVDNNGNDTGRETTGTIDFNGYDLQLYDSKGKGLYWITNLTTTDMFKEYIAIIEQSGTSAPTATILKNTFGEVFTYARSGTGNYTVTSPGSLFTLDKTFLQISNAIGGNLNPVLSRVSTSVISLQSRTTSGVGVDTAFVGSYATTVVIRVYN